MTNVKVRVIYECGRCGNLQIRTYTASNGLLEVPNCYCGCCTRQKNFTVMSSRITEATLVEETTESRSEEGLGGRSEMPEGQSATETVEQPKSGWVGTDETDDEDGAKGKRRIERMPPIPKKTRVDGR